MILAAGKFSNAAVLEEQRKRAICDFWIQNDRVIE
jgi:hypothetical protein